MTVEAYIKENPSSKTTIDSVNTLLSPLGIHIDEVIKGAQSIKYRLNLPLDLSVQKKVMNNERTIKYAISSALNSTDFIYGKDATAIYFEVKSNEFKVVNFNDLKGICKSKNLNLVLGKDENGNNIYTNLSKAPHILVGGTTGSGKSELLHTFIASLIEGMPYTKVEMAIIDPKRSEYSVYKNRKRVRLITEVSEAISLLNYSVDIMEQRYRELERTNTKDIYGYTGNMDMRPLVIIIDELADLMQTNREVEKPIVRIAQKARACGIHLIIGTQSPRKTVVTGLIQTNTPTKIALHTADALESRIILGKSGAEKLLGKGDMIFHGNGAMSDVRIQSAYVSDYQKKILADRLPSKVEKKVEEKPTRPVYQNHIPPTPPQETYTNLGNRIVYNEPTTPKRNRVGLFQGFINLMKAKPIMFTTTEYPPRI